MLASPTVYIHFPWCVKKCPYCDFNSHPLRDADDFDTYNNALLLDIASQVENLSEVGSIFLGGGTPSLFAPEHFSLLLNSLPLATQCEVTMEANPGTTEHANFEAYRQAGINRLSIGGQSFDDAQLLKLGRIHKAQETRDAFVQARQAGFTRINIDLMWGLPGQTLNQALYDLECAIELGADHISWYQLTIEAKTEFAQRPPLLPIEQTLLDIESAGLTLLQDAGYQRYEVSAFAKPNQACQHNLNYWQFGDYLGIGAGAHGKLSTLDNATLLIQRSNKASQPRLYQANPEDISWVQVDPDERACEFMMNALRLIDGVEYQVFTEQTGLPWAHVEVTWQALVDKGLVRSDRCATTVLGLRYLDTVLASFL